MGVDLSVMVGGLVCGISWFVPEWLLGLRGSAWVASRPPFLSHQGCILEFLSCLCAYTNVPEGLAGLV